MAQTTELGHLRRAFWRAIRDGQSTVAAAEQAGVAIRRGQRWFRECGGVAPVELTEPAGRYLSLAEREEIAIGLAERLSLRAIGRRIGRPPSTVSRELRRPGATTTAGHYRAVAAQRAAEERARR